jgi:GPH family glycoside/pentoside/hexuronide:cation symporter
LPAWRPGRALPWSATVELESPLSQVPAAPGARRLSLTTRFFYGFGAIAFGVKDNGFSYFLLIFYNQVVGLKSTSVGLAIMIALMFDAFLDPVVGQISDNWRSRWGRRHPFMYAAAVPVSVSFLLLWNPPLAWSHQALFFYLIAVAVIIRSCITLYEIPSTALAAELTTEYDERTRLLAYRFLFGWIGGVAVYFAALTVFLRPDAQHASGQLNGPGYARYGLFAAGVMFASILISAIGTHREIPKLRVAPHRKLSLGLLAREMFGTLRNGSFLTILVAGLFVAMGGGLVLSLNLYFQTFFWQMSSAQTAMFTFASLSAAAFAFLAAPWFSKRFGKKSSAIGLILCAIVFGCSAVALRLLGAFPANGSPALFPTLFVLSMLSTGCTVTSNILTSSMIADVVEDSELRTGRRSEGLFFAASAFIGKAVTGIGIFASSIILLIAGFPEHAKAGEVSPQVIHHLGVVYLPTLLIIYLLGAAFMVPYRITRESHAATLRELAAARDLVDEGEPASSTAKIA